MGKDMILGLVRHVLTFGGGFLTSAGTLAQSEVEAAIGAVITLAGIVWSALDKKAKAA